MTPFKLYISFDREIRNRKDGLFINTIETTYWLNKAVQEFVDKKYKEFENTEDISQDLKGLYNADRFSVFIVNTEFPDTITTTLPSDLRYITNENCTITIDSIDKITKITPCTQDTFNIKKFKDPFSQHILHQNNAEPLRLIEGNSVYLTTDGTYTIKYYDIKYIKEPTLFTVQSALSLTNITEFPNKSFKEILAIAVRMCLENYSKDRYKIYNIEEIKTEL